MLRNPELDLINASSKLCENTLECLTEQDYAATKLFNKCGEGSMQGTCSIRETQGDELRGKEKERISFIHNEDDASSSKYRKYDDLGDLNISKQFTLNVGAKDTNFSDKSDLFPSKDDVWNNKFCPNRPDMFNSEMTELLEINELKGNRSYEVLCPICHQGIKIQSGFDKNLLINNHVDICLNNHAISNSSFVMEQKNESRDNKQAANKINKKRQGISSDKRSNTGVITNANSILNYMCKNSQE